MTTSRILFFGRNASIMAIVRQQLSSAGMDAWGSLDEAAVAEHVRSGTFGLLVIGGGVEEAPRERLKLLCEEHGLHVLEHFGGPRQLIENVTRVLG